MTVIKREEKDRAYENARHHWFRLYEQVNAIETPLAVIDCLSMCQALCCPRKKMPAPQVGSFVSFLPFELEYIADVLKLDVANQKFAWEEITLLDGTELSVPWTRECPFLNGIRCDIYSFRPLDCRSFPLMASAFREAQLEFELNTNCPGHHDVTEPFRRHISEIWRMIYSSIPQTWWDLLEEIVDNGRVYNGEN